MVKRKKHDKDKYYNLARQQGYRARSAFKLIQLNKKYDFLSSAKVCIDLCAAPGGWCQVAAKYMPVSSIILGIDLLPIRPIRNVKTFQCDITTQKCRQIIKQELQTWQADVVLCDGAPNVGAEYSKDAYVQNELALIALKLAVDVLGRDGTFVTKVFRSQDYNALLWVFKQLFKKVSATKPLSSRNESAEIFVVCEKYLAPQSIDPKMLDPKHVFGQIDNENKGINIFHPKYGQQRRHREGYNEDLGMTLSNKVSVTDFINSMDPIQLLTDATEIQFITYGDKQIKEYKETNEEILTCLSDLKVLGKSEFKNLLKWRTKMKGYLTKLNKEDESDIKKRNEEIQLASVPETITEEQHEDNINEELAQIRSNVVSKKKREKKKEREKKAKLRLRAAMGMDLNTVELQQDDSIFNLQTLNLSKDNVNDLNESTVLPEDCEDDDVLKNESSESSDSDSDDDADTKKMESEMDEMYNAFLNRKGTKDMNRKAVKRSKIAKRALAGEALVEDHAMYDGDMKAYEEMLAVEQSDDSSDEDENRLVVKPKIKEDEPVVVSRWFSSNPLFNDIEEKLMATRTNIEDEKEHSDADTVEMHEDEDGDLIPKMPLTEKEKRKIKRKNLVEKKEKKLAKQQSSNLKLTGERDDYELVGNDEIEEINELKKDDTLETEEQKQKKALIRQGMGNTINESDLNTSKNIEVVPLEKEELPVFDDRKYDSDAEEYDEEDRAKTLALAHLMMRKSKAKELIDASYNRYTWNDSADLPDWFVDDEEKHYRAQIPVSKEVLDEMKTRFLEMATKPLKKVAEARARKKRLQLKKMKTARKKATDIANMPDMSNREKIKAIEGTMKSAKLQKKNKVYVVSRRNGKTSNAKNQKKGSGGGSVKLVDARLRADTRNLKMKKKRGKKK